MNDRIDQLERLSRLHKEGSLTDAEFEREKAALDSSAAKPRKSGSKAVLVASLAVLAVAGIGALVFVQQGRPQTVTPDAANPVVPEPVIPPIEMQESLVPEAAEPRAEPIAPSNVRETLPRDFDTQPNLVGGFREYRTRIREGWKDKPNLAGIFVVIRWGCGTGCTHGVVGNKETGQLYWLELGGEDYPYLQLEHTWGWDHLTATWQPRGDVCASQMFRWTGTRMEPQEDPVYRKRTGEDCSER